jgi:murein DD-endopeptidase MepM/ murein hydrolase activator NlpD
VVFTTAEGTLIAETESFPVTLARDVHVGVALLGVPSTVPAKTYRVRIVDAAEGADAADESPGSDGAQAPDGAPGDRERQIVVRDREFVRETIALNQSLTELRSEPDPQKVEEARRLIALVAQVDTSALYTSGTFDLPVEEFRETSFFGDRRTFAYADGANANAIHFGLDLAAPTGTPVYAPAPGEVVFAGDRIVTGLSVVVEHLPGVYGLYYHLDRIDVDLGDRVDRGAPIGTLGATGLATGPHLHWEIRVAGVPVEPKTLLSEPLLDRPTVYRDILTQDMHKGGDDNSLRPD